jgi:hypothetical protein
MDERDMKTEETVIVCPECDRQWPRVSEQGVVTEKIDKCYACFITGVVSELEALREQVDYVVDNCDECLGQMPQRLNCIKCGGKGWITVDKVLANSVLQVVN